MLAKSIHLLFKMNLKYVAVIGLLIVAVVFLLMDNCGSSDKYNRLKGEYNFYRALSKRVVAESVRVINEQTDEIEKLDEKIGFLNTIIEVKDKDLADKEEELGVIKRDFESLGACQSQYNKLVEAFTLCKSISADKDGVIFSLNEKYEAQVIVSLEYQEMYNSVRDILAVRDKQVKELEKINRRLKFGSKLKTGLAITLAGLVVYSLLKD